MALIAAPVDVTKGLGVSSRDSIGTCEQRLFERYRVGQFDMRKSLGAMGHAVS